MSIHQESPSFFLKRSDFNMLRSYKIEASRAMLNYNIMSSQPIRVNIIMTACVLPSLKSILLGLAPHRLRDTGVFSVERGCLGNDRREVPSHPYSVPPFKLYRLGVRIAKAHI
jgi:hypothetical protein